MIKSINVLFLRVKLLKDFLEVNKLQFHFPFREISINSNPRGVQMMWMGNLPKLKRNLAAKLIKNNNNLHLGIMYDIVSGIIALTA